MGSGASSFATRCCNTALQHGVAAPRLRILAQRPGPGYSDRGAGNRVARTHPVGHPDPIAPSNRPESPLLRSLHRGTGLALNNGRGRRFGRKEYKEIRP